MLALACTKSSRSCSLSMCSSIRRIGTRAEEMEENIKFSTEARLSYNGTDQVFPPQVWVVTVVAIQLPSEKVIQNPTKKVTNR